MSRSKSKQSLLPAPSHKTELFKQRYHIVHQRLLRNENFQQQPLAGSKRPSHPSDGSPVNNITPIANLLGRTRTQHLLLGLLIVLPTGTLAVSDLTGSIALDMQDTSPIPDASSVLFCPGMILLVEGIYVEDGSGEAALGSMGGIGATIGGKFLALSLAHPPAERRVQSLGIQTGPDAIVGPAFGWTDFLGVGSERATGTRMRRLQSRLLNSSPSPSISAPEPTTSSTKIAIASDVTLDQPSTLTAIRSLFAHYASQPASATPLSIILLGNFASQPALASSSSTSLLYKESFNSLAAVLADFPSVLARTTLVFVPGDADAWPSAFGAGGAVPLPRRGVPQIFTTRVGRVVAEANREVRGKAKSGGSGKEGEVVWASNPARLTWFGCVGEMVLFRDDISGRVRRSMVRFAKEKEPAEVNGDAEMQDGLEDSQPIEVDGNESSAHNVTESSEQVDADVAAARQLTRTILEQAHLSPFPISSRPVHWDYGSVLSLFPLPSSLVLADPEAPAFTLNYMGCCVMNPGRLVEGRKTNRASWIEYDILMNKGEVVIKGD
jgi:DNA polymerase epsilon subunit 2